MSEADVWTPHLHADERVLWQAPLVEDRYLAELSRQRKLGLFILVVALIAAIMFGVSLAELVGGQGRSLLSNLSALLFLPIYCAAILACLGIAIGQVTRFNLPRPAAVRYAVTTGRLLAMDAKGALVDQLEGGEIAAVRFVGPDVARNLSVKPSQPREFHREPFVIAYVDGLADAKTAVEETFLQPQT